MRPIDGLVFPECPRWRHGRLYFSDMHGHRVWCRAPDGVLTEVVSVPDGPGGLGWLPDGRLLVVSMRGLRVLVVDGDAIALWADLDGRVRFQANDLVCDARGGAYVSNFGFDVLHGEAWRTTTLVYVRPDGQPVVVADDLMFPNGMVLADEGRTLIVSEQPACRLVAFDVADDGTLSGRRVWADALPGLPDGLALAPDGSVWAALPIGGRFDAPQPSRVIRVAEGGALLDEHLGVDGFDPYAVAISDEGHTLAVCESRSALPEAIGPGNGRVRFVGLSDGRVASGSWGETHR